MANQRIERVDEIPLILHWLKVMRIAEIIDDIWQPHGNWHSISYGQLAALYITYVIHSFKSPFIRDGRMGNETQNSP
jgi:hypothetical protein